MATLQQKQLPWQLATWPPFLHALVGMVFTTEKLAMTHTAPLKTAGGGEKKKEMSKKERTDLRMLINHKLRLMTQASALPMVSLT